MSKERPPSAGPGDDDPRVDDRLDEVWEALDEGDLESALELAEQLVADFPQSGNAALGLAAAQYEAGSIRATLEAAQRAGELQAEDEPLRRWYVAAAHHYLWDFERARTQLLELTRSDPDFAEAWYLLAQVDEIEGDEVGARRGYEQAFGIDSDRFPRPHRLDESAMRDAVQAARDELPPRFQEILDELAIVIEPHPSRELAQPEGEDEDPIPPDVLGLFVGNSQLEQSVFSPVAQPGVIFLFQRNLERVCGDAETLIEEIRTTLWHELAHYLGFEEDQMADLGLESSTAPRPLCCPELNLTAISQPERRFSRTLVTAALPYANGPIHLGHLAGVYVPADVYVRFLRMHDESVLFICGTDEHGVPITLAAESAGITPQELVDRNFAGIRDSFAALGVNFDNFSQTSRTIHHETSRAFFLDLHHSGVLEEGTSLQYFSEQTGRFYPDRYVEGTCPNCGNTRARGDQCESCGTQIEPVELIEPRSITDGAPITLKESTHWFFPLGRFQEWLQGWIGSHPEWKENVLNYCRGWFDQGLGNRAVTRDLHWGVPVPLPDHEGKVLYVWFDAPIGYISATREWAIAQGDPELWRTWWQDAQSRLVHFIGKDNIVFHAILFPAMLHAHRENYVVPDNVPANEFLNLEGQKLSTSRGHAVWLPDYLERFPPDSLRYSLVRNLPEMRDTNFTWSDFQARHNSELADALGNFVNRALTFTGKYFDDAVPPRGELGPADAAALQRILDDTRTIEEQMRAFRIRAAAETLFLLTKEANRYFDEAAPWATRKTDPARCATSLYVCCQFVRAFCGLWAPLLPHTMQTLWEALGVEGDLQQVGWPSEARWLAEGHPVTKPPILFAKIEDEAIEAEKARLPLADPAG